VHERVRRHQPPSNGRRKHWWPEGAICHEGRNAEAKQYKGNCLCQHGYAPNKRAAAASAHHQLTLPPPNRLQWKPFIYRRQLAPNHTVEFGGSTHFARNELRSNKQDCGFGFVFLVMTNTSAISRRCHTIVLGWAERHPVPPESPAARPEA